LVNINHIRGYSINNYLNFYLSYKLTIDHIPVVYKQFNQINQHQLNTNLYYTLRLERGRPPPSPCPRSSPRPLHLPPCNPTPARAVIPRRPLALIRYPSISPLTLPTLPPTMGSAISDRHIRDLAHPASHDGEPHPRQPACQAWISHNSQRAPPQISPRHPWRCPPPPTPPPRARLPTMLFARAPPFPR
jgi:hypothetical protein